MSTIFRTRRLALAYQVARSPSEVSLPRLIEAFITLVEDWKANGDNADISKHLAGTLWFEIAEKIR